MRVIFLIVPLLAINGATSNAQDKSFTVRDSIEMSTFIDPETRFGDGRDAAVKFSPDGKHFAVVTIKGNIQSDEIEGSLWLFDSDAVRSILLAQDARKTVAPRIVARLAARTNDGALISNVSWSSDSKRILFVGKKTNHGRQLYQVDITSGATRPLTPQDLDVSQYRLRGGTGVYVASVPNEDLELVLKGQPINADVQAVTGMPLGAILFPNRLLKSDALKLHELWTIRNEKNVRLIDPDSGRPIRPIIDGGLANLLSLSPDGRSLVTIRPMNRWNAEWDSYEPDNPHKKFHNQAASLKLMTYWADLPAEYALIDLESGKSTSLVNAPLARLQGYGQPLRAVWSADGKKVVLTATYLPLAGVESEERARRSRPCAAAVVEIPFTKVTCVRTMSRTIDPNGLFVRDVSFGKSNEEVVLNVVTIENKGEQIERYQEQGGTWKRLISFAEDNGVRDQLTREDPNKGALSVFVRQGLNLSPALFATDLTHGQPKRIWDPNPQLSMMNLGVVSVLRWNDSNGYAWVAGLVKPLDYAPGKKYPLVIQTHGFVENKFLTDGGYTTALAARPLASAGFVVLQMPYNPTHTGTAKEVSDQIAGFESAIDLLTSEGLIERRQIGIIGFSRTCFHVEGILIKDPTLFAAATIADGVDESYMQYLLNSVGTEAPKEQEAIHGAKPFGEGLRNWMQSAPGFSLDKVRTPLRIEANSGLESVLQEWEIYASMIIQHRPVDLIYFPDGVHVLQKPLERLASQQGNVDWFRFWLKGEEDPDPAKAEQYVRWRELRTLQEKNEAMRAPKQ